MAHHHVIKEETIAIHCDLVSNYACRLSNTDHNKQINMTRKSLDHKLQPKPQHHEDEQKHRHPQDRDNTIKVKHLALSCSARCLQNQ